MDPFADRDPDPSREADRIRRELSDGERRALGLLPKHEGWGVLRKLASERYAKKRIGLYQEELSQRAWLGGRLTGEMAALEWVIGLVENVGLEPTRRKT